jgi:glycosyltransferase involved in cell wall biosynthesis
VTFAQFDIRENHLFDNYDLIVCSEVLGYLPSAAELERILQGLSLSLKRDGLLLMANAKAVADEPTGRGFDWGRPFGAHTIAETAAACGLETIAALTAPLYEIRLLRRGKPRAIEPGVALMGWLSPSAAACAKPTEKLAWSLKSTAPKPTSSLTLKCENRISGLPIVLRNGTTSRSEYGDLLASCDAVLSLHRSEGLGLIPIEALYQSKPVVATEYGGVTDFLDETTSFPVEFTSARLEQDYGPYPKGAVWAEPSIASAVEQMKRVIENPQLATDRTRRGHRKVTELYGYEAATRRFGAELDRIFASRQ